MVWFPVCHRLFEWGVFMVLLVLRALFVLLMAAVGWYYLRSPTQFWGDYTWLALAASLVVGTLFLTVDMLAPRKKLAIFSGTFFGLIVGISVSYALSFVVRLLVEQFVPLGTVPGVTATDQREVLIQFINMLLGVTTCYLAISFILQTKDDFRFVIPYVEFSKQTKGARPILLDTSVLIDGRIVDIVSTGMLESQMIVPRFVILELQTVADSADRLKRNRGRRGLDVLAELQASKLAEVVLYEASIERSEGSSAGGVDHRLMELAKELNARVLTNDLNLNKVAQLSGVRVININDLANALKPVVLPGERMTVHLLKPGEQPGQGVGYLEDGTMVVVEQGRSHLNEDLEFTVTSVMQTSAGKMIFGRAGDSHPPGSSTGSHPPRRTRAGRAPEQTPTT